MAEIDKQALRVKIDRDLPSTGAGAITAAGLRSVLHDMVDSLAAIGASPGPGPGPLPTARTYAIWYLDSDGTPTIDEVTNDGPGGRTITLPPGAWSGPVRLWALIPESHWPLPDRPEMSGIAGGLTVTEVSRGHNVENVDFVLIQNNAQAALIAEQQRVITWWPAT